MPKHCDSHLTSVDLEDQMKGKFLQIASSTVFIHETPTSWIFLDRFHRTLEFFVETVSGMV